MYQTLLSRNDFREYVFYRDSYSCVICNKEAVDAHHIIERKLWNDGGYYIDNGASLCSECHIKAEKCIISVETIREKTGITNIILPEGMSPELRYDKWGNIMADFYKYPRTRHIVGSSLQKDDQDDFVSVDELEGKYLVIEEKIDGANTGMSFDNDLNFKLQSRGHYLEGGDYSQFDQFKTWATTFQEAFFDILENQYIMYGEWMSNFHSLFYDRLPHFFMEFDIFDPKTNTFLSTQRRKAMLDQIKDQVQVHQVLVLDEGVMKNGKVNGSTLEQFIGRSNFQSPTAFDTLSGELERINLREDRAAGLLKLNDGIMEGLYIKWEEDGVVKGRYKFVREGFTQTIIDGGQHHLKRPVIHNQLHPDASLY